jgi:hypothetical protein
MMNQNYFQHQKKGLKQKVIKISNNMKNECDDKFKNKLNEFLFK